MLAQLVEYWLTPSSKATRAMGYVPEVIGIRARYARCAAYWEEHLKRTREVILQGAARAQKRRKAVILGGGLFHDVPISELSQMFEKVVLVDIVHSFVSRWKTRRYPNVHRLTADVTNTVEALYRVAHREDQPLPVSEPTLMLDDPELDFTASVNLLSQLPCMPESYLKKQRAHSPEAIRAFSAQLIEAHLKYLSQLPGAVALITDIMRLKIDTLGRVVERRDLLYSHVLGKFGSEWDWRLAPIPEVDRNYHYFRRVVGIPDWK